MLVGFVFEYFVKESGFDRRESGMDLADFVGYLSFILVIVVISWCSCTCCRTALDRSNQKWAFLRANFSAKIALKALK